MQSLINIDRFPYEHSLLHPFSEKVFSITASFGCNFGSIMAFSKTTPRHFEAKEAEFSRRCLNIAALMPFAVAQKHSVMVD